MEVFPDYGAVTQKEDKFQCFSGINSSFFLDPALKAKRLEKGATDLEEALAGIQRGGHRDFAHPQGEIVVALFVRHFKRAPGWIAGVLVRLWGALTPRRILLMLPAPGH